MGHKAYVTEVRINRQEIRLTMYQNARLDTVRIPDLVASYGDELRFVMAEQPYFLYVDRRNKAEGLCRHDGTGGRFWDSWENWLSRMFSVLPALKKRDEQISTVFL